MIQRRHFTHGLMAAAVPALVPGLAQAQSGRTVSIQVGFPAGSSIDVLARLVADKFRTLSGESYIVENKVGAAGRLAMETLKRSAGDGRTMAIVPSPLLTNYAHVYKKIGYDALNDFQVASIIGTFSLCLIVGPAVPASVKDVADLVAWIKAQPKPPFFSANAQGSGPHFLGLSFSEVYGAPASFVSYQGGNAALNSLLAGDIHFAFLPAAQITGFVKDGRLRILASSGKGRSRFTPTTPSFVELGKPQLELTEWLAICVPKSTDAKSVQAIQAMWKKAVSDPEIVAKFTPLGMDLADISGDQANAILVNDYRKMGSLIKASGFTFEE